MPRPPAKPVCGACFPAHDQIVEECIQNEEAAFARYTDLILEGRNPALCQRDTEEYRVCYPVLRSTLALLRRH